MGFDKFVRNISDILHIFLGVFIMDIVIRQCMKCMRIFEEFSYERCPHCDERIEYERDGYVEVSF